MINLYSDANGFIKSMASKKEIPYEVKLLYKEMRGEELTQKERQNFNALLKKTKTS